MTPAEYVRGGTTLREATRADLLDVLRIERAVFPQPWPYSAFERHVDAPGFLVSECDASDTSADGDDGESADTDTDTIGGLAAADNSITGYVVATAAHTHGQSLGHVKNLAVRPAHRHDGVGSALLAQSLAVLSRQGVRGAKLEVRRGNDAARRLYRSFGFERQRTIPEYYADGEDALLLVVDLRDRDAF